jgi:hypothetical protein
MPHFSRVRSDEQLLRTRILAHTRDRSLAESRVRDGSESSLLRPRPNSGRDADGLACFEMQGGDDAPTR